MLTIDCPWCDRPMPIEDGETVQCDACGVELAFAADEPARPAVALAA